jgi:iron complex outermembrane recepter protein
MSASPMRIRRIHWPSPRFVLGDLALHYQIANWRFALNVTNIGDHIYVGGCSTATACFYGDRRRTVASVSYKW